MKLFLILGLLFSSSVFADPLKKMQKRKDYCSPLQKMMGGCKKTKKTEPLEEESTEALDKKLKKEKKAKEEESEEFLR